MQKKRFLSTGPQISVSGLQKLLVFFFSFCALTIHVSANSIQFTKNTENCHSSREYEKSYLTAEGEPVILRVFYPRLQNAGLLSHHYNLSWHKNDSKRILLGMGKSARIRMINDALWILPASLEDTGTYIYTLRNESYCATSYVQLEVFKNTKLSQQSNFYQQRLPSSRLGYLVCPEINEFIQNGSNMEIKWYKDSVLLDQSNKNFSILKGSIYIYIQNVSWDSAGYYTCQMPFVYDGVKYNITRHILLRVMKRMEETIPIFITPNETILATVGSKLTIPCKVLGTQSTIIWWTANNTHVDLLYKGGRVKEGQSQVYTENNKRYIELLLIFESVEKNDLNTEFKCIAQSVHGLETLQARVKEESSFSWGIAVAPLSVIFMIFFGIWIHRRCKKRPGKVYSPSKSKIISHEYPPSTP